MRVGGATQGRCDGGVMSEVGGGGTFLQRRSSLRPFGDFALGAVQPVMGVSRLCPRDHT